MEARLGRRDADRAGERLQRHAGVLAEQRRLERAGVVGPDVQRRLLELVGEQPETRNVRRPAEAGRLERLDRHLQRVARLGAFDVDRPGHRVDLAEVEPGHVGDRAVGRQLTAGSVEALELDRRTRARPARPGRNVVPAEMMVAPVDRVVAAIAHR